MYNNITYKKIQNYEKILFIDHISWTIKQIITGISHTKNHAPIEFNNYFQPLHYLNINLAHNFGQIIKFYSEHFNYI